VNYHDLWRDRTEIFEDGRYLTERITGEAVAFIGQNRSEPFFAYVAYNAPHYPMHAPEQYMNRFPGLPLERRIYAAMIAAVDDGIGAIRKTLERSGQFDNTLIFLLGDNGATTERRAGIDQQYATAGDNGVYKGFKFSLFDGGHHVPALASWPARFGGRSIAEPVMSMDILPTVCQAAGAPLPGGLDGAGILPLITGGSKAPHEYLFWTQDGQLAVRRGRWKLVINGRLWDRRPDGYQPLAGEDAVWLSDLQEDPGETRNLRRKQPSIADELATAVEKWRRTLPGS
jgi:arylsulfatase A-like enzyme